MKFKKWFLSLGFIAVASYLIVSLNDKNSDESKEKNEINKQHEEIVKKNIEKEETLKINKTTSKFTEKALKKNPVILNHKLEEKEEIFHEDIFENKIDENNEFSSTNTIEIKDAVNEEALENSISNTVNMELNKKPFFQENEELTTEKNNDYKTEVVSVKTEPKEVKFKIDSIELKNLLILKKDAEKIKKTYENRTLGLVEINSLISELSNLYLKNGYISTRVMMSVPQNLNSGKLQLEIINGTIEKFSYGRNKIREKTVIATAFPFLRGDVLNLKDIENGIKVVNSVPSNNMKMKILPGSTMGDSIIELTNEKEKRYRVGLIYDNAGEENTGVNRGKLTLGLDNLFGINDVFNFTYTNSLSDDIKNNYSRSFAGNYRFPLGKYNFTTNQQYSDYSIPIKGINNDYTSKGNTYEQLYSIDREINFFNSVDENLKIKMNLKDRKNYMQDLLLNKSSYKTSDMSLEYLVSKGIQNGSVSLNLAYTHDIKLETDVNKEKEFEKLNINFDLSKVYRKKKFALIYTLNTQSQLSKKDLYGISEMSIGDDETLRGYKDNEISGDNGILFTNNLIYRPITQNKYLQGFQFFTGLDYGVVYNHEDKKNQDLLGVATGTRWNYKHLGVNLTWAKGLTKDDQIKENNGEIYTEVSLNY